MQKISSNLTYFHKRVRPGIWIAIGLFLTYVSVIIRPRFGFYRSYYLTEIFSAFFLIAGGKEGFFPKLVDEVYDCGDYLIVKNGDYEDRISFENIADVHFKHFGVPSRIRLVLRKSMNGTYHVTFAPIRKKDGQVFHAAPLIQSFQDRIAASKCIG